MEVRKIINHAKFGWLTKREKLFLENFAISDTGNKDIDFLNLFRDIRLYGFVQPEIILEIYKDAGGLRQRAELPF